MFTTPFARRVRTAVLAGLTALATTTFQNGCSYGMGTSVDTLLNSLMSDYSDSYDSWDGYGSSNSSSNSYRNWDLLNVRSG